MSETSRIVQTEIGYTWHVSIDREIRKPTEAKCPDKTVIKASLTGHEMKYGEALTSLNHAKRELEKLTKGPCCPLTS